MKSEKFPATIPYKAGFTKNSVNAMNKYGEGFQYFKTNFPLNSDAKLNERICYSLAKYVCFNLNLRKVEKRVWNGLIDGRHSFLENNYQEIVHELLSV